MRRDYRRAVEILTAVLESEPANSEVLLLLGMTYDKWGLRKYEDAKNYYRRLAETENRTAQFTGLYFLSSVLHVQKDYSSLIPVCERLLKEHGNMPETNQSVIQSRLTQAKKSLQ